jgi:hypothetical protein
MIVSERIDNCFVGNELAIRDWLQLNGNGRTDACAVDCNYVPSRKACVTASRC